MANDNITLKFNVKKCIGNGICARMAPEFFEFPGKKAILIDSNKEGDSEVWSGDSTEEQIKNAVAAARGCPVNAITVKNNSTNTMLFDDQLEMKKQETIWAEYDDLQEFVMDNKGYFLIRVNKEENCIEIAHCYDINKIDYIIKGKKPIEIYQTAIKKGLIIRHDHAAYLGRELQKAYIALQKGIKYVQDDELEF